MAVSEVEIARLRRMETLVSRFRWIGLFVSGLLLNFGRGYLIEPNVLWRFYIFAIVVITLVQLNLQFRIVPLRMAAIFSTFVDYLFVVILIIFTPGLPNLWPAFILLIIATAMRFGLGASMATSLVSVFFMFGLQIYRSEEMLAGEDIRIFLVRAVMLMLIALFSGFLAKEERDHYIARELHDERRNRQRETIFRIGQALTSSLDLTEILQVIVESTNIILFSSGSSIYELDSRTGDLVLVATNGLPHRFTRRIHLRFGDALAGQVAQAKEAMSSPDISQLDSPIKPIFEEFGIRSILAVPLVLEDEVVGVLETYSKKMHVFNDEEIELLKLFSSQAAVAIENAKLHQMDQEIAKRAEKKASDLETLFRTAQTVTSSLKIDTVLNRVMDEVERVLQARVVSLMLYDSELDQVRVKIARGLTRHHIENASFRPGEGVEGEAFANKKALMIGDIMTDERFKLKDDAKNERLRSLLSVPLQVKGRAIGVLNIYSEKKDGFTQNDLELLQTFAAQAAIAIDNARLHEALIAEERRRQDEEMRMARDIQQSLLPKRSPKIPGLDVGFVCIQARQVGGDFYDFIPLDGRFAIVIGDVSGKFLPAAMLVSMNKYVLRSVSVKAESVTDPLRTLNRVLVDETDPEIFVTLIYGIYDPVERSFEYSNAGHMPILHIEKESGQATFRRRHELVLGVDEAMEFRSDFLSIAEGDVIILFSDGVTEARDRDGNIFGMQSLKDLALKHTAGSAQEIAAAITDEVMQFSGEAVQDDYTILVLKGVPGEEDRIVVRNIERSVRQVRDFVRRVARKVGGFTDEDVENLCLAADEAFSNAVRHGQDFSSANEVAVICALEDDGLVVEIIDSGKGNFVPDLENWPMPDLTSEHGRGVYIIKNIMDELVYMHREKGTAVRFRKAMPGGEA